MANSSFWRKAALSSKPSLASAATTLPSWVSASGFTCARARPAPVAPRSRWPCRAHADCCVSMEHGPAQSHARALSFMQDDACRVYQRRLHERPSDEAQGTRQGRPPHPAVRTCCYTSVHLTLSVTAGTPDERAAWGGARLDHGAVALGKHVVQRLDLLSGRALVRRDREPFHHLAGLRAGSQLWGARCRAGQRTCDG